MKKRDTNKNFLIKKFFGVDSTYYKPNPRYTRRDSAPMHIALIIDGIVEDIMHCDERLGLLLMSNPNVVDISENLNNVSISDFYDEETNSFSRGVTDE